MLYIENIWRALFRSLVWRMVGSLLTFGALMATGIEMRFVYAFLIYELIAKFLLGFGHEYMWTKIPLGYIEFTARANWYRSLLKSLAWRAIAGVFTFFVLYMVRGDLDLVIRITFFDLLVKSIFFFVADQAWNRITIGIKRTDKPTNNKIQST